MSPRKTWIKHHRWGNYTDICSTLYRAAENYEHLVAVTYSSTCASFLGFSPASPLPSLGSSPEHIWHYCMGFTASISKILKYFYVASPWLPWTCFGPYQLSDLAFSSTDTLKTCSSDLWIWRLIQLPSSSSVASCPSPVAKKLAGFW